MARSITGSLLGKAAHTEYLDRKVVSVKLSALEHARVKLNLARSLQNQKQWKANVEIGEEMEQDVLLSLVELCNTDPLHVAQAEPATPAAIKVGKVIVDKSFAERWSTDPQDYKDKFNAEEVEFR